SYDLWFLRQIEDIVHAEAELKKNGLPKTPEEWMRIKKLGFADGKIGELTGNTELFTADARIDQNVLPVFKRIDTCAAEFPSPTPYLYACYEGDGINPAECEAEPSDRKKVVILGGGPNRIGQGIEFDYCCVHVVMACREAGHETIMINCNPETVSTDYDTADRLYFEPLTAENVIDIVRREQSNGEVLGVIVQLGGQTPLKLAEELLEAKIPILGTSPDAIDLAEDRERFQKLLQQLDLRQPSNGVARSLEEAEAVAEDVGFPLVIRPSYVLGGRAMEIVHDMAGLRRYIETAVQVSGDNPVLIDGYLQGAVEVDVDALADQDTVFIAGIMEHIEEAGIHSGDSACALPPHSLSEHVLDEIKRQTEKLAKALNVVGLMNVQYAIKDETVYLLEVNPRASRTVPFVAKATGVPIAKIAARIMAGESLASFELKEKKLGHTAVKEAVFPFNRFPGVDVILGPEMKSTGEVMGLDRDFGLAFAKSQLGAGVTLPQGGTVFISVKDEDKDSVVALAKDLDDLGFEIIGTRGTAKYLQEHGVPVGTINKVIEGQPHIVDAMIDGQIALVFNTTEGRQAISDSFSLRRTALVNNIPYYTTVAGARAAVAAIAALRRGDMSVDPLQSYLQGAY
ncbi:MAG: carbamoyl-phosphate synthase large subunit, partial [Pseudomonadota bacterium]